jgi:energy-coupling factor transporter ATP-binding protein EcfA2
MIRKIEISAFKSIAAQEIELGQLNVFVGANGSGKSNILEAIGVLSAAADGRVNDQSLMQRGVRPGVPRLYKSAFPGTAGKKQLSHIYFSAASDKVRYGVSLNNPLNDPGPGWRFKTEYLESGGEKLVSRGPALRGNPNTEIGLAALKAVEMHENDVALDLLRRLQGYVIYAPTTPVLRGVAPEMQPRQPLGISGGRLPDAVQELLRARKGSEHIQKVTSDALGLIGWARSYGTGSSADLPLSPAAASSPKVIKFVDRFIKQGRNVLSGYDASEGALFILFLAVVASHPGAPSICAVDNADHGLNPGLARALMTHLAQWILSCPHHRQLLITAHNPAVLDGLPLQDDRVRLFAVDRDNRGRTIVKRISLNQKMMDFSSRGWTLSRLWMSKLIGGMPDV